MAGIRCDIDVEEGRRLRAALGDAVRDKRSGLGYPQRHRSWPAQRPVPGPVEAEYWLDLYPYRRALIEEIVGAWDTFSETVDQAMSALRQGEGPDDNKP